MLNGPGDVLLERRIQVTARRLAVREELSVISRQAVYDPLARYEDRLGDDHHHVICRTCGPLRDVDCAVGETPC